MKRLTHRSTYLIIVFSSSLSAHWIPSSRDHTVSSSSSYAHSDPFERAYSAYTNARTNRFIFIGRCGRNRTVDDCTFEEWVDELMVNPTKSFRNEHFLPQFNIAQFDRMHYHYRLRMSSSLDRNFFWNTLVGLKELVANDSSSKQHNTTNTTDPSMDTTTTTPISPIQRKFESIPNRTIDQLATLYAVDLHLWKHFLDEGTPREPDEETMFDYYLKTRKRLPKLPPKPKPKPKNQPKSPQQQQEKQQQPQQKKPPKKKKQPEEQKNQPQKPPTLKQRQPQQLREHMMERQREQDGAKNQTVRISMQPINGTEEEKWESICLYYESPRRAALHRSLHTSIVQNEFGRRRSLIRSMKLRTRNPTKRLVFMFHKHYFINLRAGSPSCRAMLISCTGTVYTHTQLLL